jgi:SAM-dependent MidA family methyltransferase
MDDDSKFYALLGRALMEPEFRARVLDSAQQADALAELGIDPNNGDVLDQLNASIAAINRLASHDGFGEVKAVT